MKKFPIRESQGHGGHARSSAKDNRDLEVPSITSIGGGRPLTLTAADLGFWFLCALIFAGTPLVMVLR